MKKFIKINFYFLVILFFLIVNFNIFEKIYLIVSNDYNKRLLNAYGDCEKEGYGFVKKTINNKIIRSNFFVENKGDFPSIKGFFYNFNIKTNNKTYVFLINQQEENINEEYLKNYKILKQEGKCFLLRKDD